MEVNQAAVSRYCAAEQKQEHRRAIQEVVQTINSIHSKLEKEMSEERRLQVHPDQKQTPTELLLCLCFHRITHVWRNELM